LPLPPLLLVKRQPLSILLSAVAVAGLALLVVAVAQAGLEQPQDFLLLVG
jgi:hypothetical protein